MVKFNCNDNKWGNGQFMCNNNGECDTQTGMCKCFADFQHNLAFNRYRDCSTHKLVFVIFDSMDIILHFIFFLVALYYAKHSRSLARQILLLLSLSSITLVIMSAVHLSNNGNTTIATLLLLNTFFVPGNYMLYLGIFSFISPLYASAQKDSTSFRQFLDGMFLLFRLATYSLIVSYYRYSDYSIVENDEKWNECVQIYCYLVCAELFCVGGMIIFQSKKMINLATAVTKDLENQRSTGNGSASSLSVYVKRVEMLMYQVILNTPIVCVILIGVATTVLATGYFPYDWVLLVVVIASNYSANIQFINLTRRHQIPDNTADEAKLIETSSNNDTGANTTNKVAVVAVSSTDVAPTSSN